MSNLAVFMRVAMCMAIAQLTTGIAQSATPPCTCLLYPIEEGAEPGTYVFLTDYYQDSCDDDPISGSLELASNNWPQFCSDTPPCDCIAAGSLVDGRFPGVRPYAGQAGYVTFGDDSAWRIPAKAEKFVRQVAPRQVEGVEVRIASLRILNRDRFFEIRSFEADASLGKELPAALRKVRTFTIGREIESAPVNAKVIAANEVVPYVFGDDNYGQNSFVINGRVGKSKCIFLLKRD